MKKNIKLLLFSIAFLFMITGCKKILQPTIYTLIIATDFPKSDADALSALIPFYAQFNTNYGTSDPTNGRYDFSLNASYLGYGWATSIQTDEAFDEYYSSYSTFTLGASSVSNSSGQAFYDRISYVARLTALIDQINKSSIPSKVTFAAEAQALRAYFMFIIDDLYGPANPRLDPTTVNSLTISPRLSEANYAAAMVSDLNAAIAALPIKYNGTGNWGRISKGVASMILLKVYMLEAGRTQDATNWIKAQAVGQSLMGMGYSLDSSYKNVFTTAQNNEVIYAIPGNTGTSSIWFPCILPFDAKTVLGQDLTAKTNQKYKLDMMPWTFYDTYSAGDTRLQTIANSYVNTSGVTIGRTNGLDGAIPMKYPFVVGQLGFDFVMFQYSDVLLSMAEIDNEINKGPTGTGIGYLTQVTARANTTIPASALAGHDAFSNFILAERGRELYWLSGIRRQDLIRHGTFISNAVARGLPAKANQVLFPIPSDVIIQSNGIVTQNPGY